MNSVTLSGHLTHDPELLHREDRPVCEMRLAVNNGSNPTTYVDVVTFDEQAYICAEYMHKGSKIGVSGRLIYREWRGADGTKRSRHSVIGWVEFLDRPPREERSGPEGSEPEPESQLALAS